MTVDGWVYEAVQAAGARGATVREVQRWIDEYRHEELAIDTLEASLAALVEDGRLQREGEGRYKVARRTDKADALRRLFGE